VDVEIGFSNIKERIMDRNTTKISRGFTLIELFVVIAIIALLLAILGPSLGKAKDQVRETICRSNMKSWALVYALYANDNEDSFPQSVATDDVSEEDAWLLGALLPYYEDLGLRDCLSTKNIDRVPDQYNYGGTFIEWGPFPPTETGDKWWDDYAEGSYGFNDWIADPPPGISSFWGLSSKNAVRTTFEEGAYMIPLIYDSVWCDTAPKMTDWAPDNGEHEMDKYDCSWADDALKYVCIDRHGGGVNAAFVDMDARHVGIKEIWYLKWHANWNRCVPPNAWPSWTDRYKDYD